MLSTTFALLLTAPLAVLAQTCTKSSTQKCSTMMATVPQWWPVLTNTRTSLLPTTTLTGTTTAFTTVTVPAIPITVKTTVTTTTVVTSTAQPGTDTFLATTTTSVTSTATTTTITTGTTTSTTTSTSTLLSTSIVPAPSNFINVLSSSGDSNYAGSKKRTESNKRGLLDLIAALFKSSTTIATSQITSKPHFNILDWNNPVAVNCIATVAPICNRAVTTIKTTSVTAAPSTVTSTVLFTSTSTKIIVPQNVTQTIIAATLTSTISTTLFVTSAATTTTILTQITTSTSTTTTYAACATGNILGPRIANGQAISPLQFFDSSATVLTSPKVSPYDCCVACMIGNNCQNFQFQASTGTCWIIGGNQDWCPNNDQTYNSPAYFTTKDAGSATDILIVGNGPCGTTMDAGPSQ